MTVKEIKERALARRMEEAREFNRKLNNERVAREEQKLLDDYHAEIEAFLAEQ
jgi:hypothetical protein